MTLPPIAVLGLGTMGLGIAQVFAQAGHPVLATDQLPAARDSGPDRLAAALAPRVASGRLSAAEAEAVRARLTVVSDLSALAPAAMVIEAAVEDIAIKQALFAQLERLCPGAVLATNTSSLQVAAIASGLRAPERLIGLHFFNPAPVMRLVELITPPGAEAAAALAAGWTRAAGKTVVAAPDTPGFIVNRCARPFYGEALALLEEGRDPAAIDAAMIAAGYRMGPFALIDLVGADINLAATRSLSAAMAGHPRYYVFAALVEQVAAGRLGRKSGGGFLTGTVAPPSDDAAQIATRIEAALVNEALWLVSETCTTREAVDTALQLGLNFPRGPFQILDGIGMPALRDRLATLEEAAPAHLRGRYLLPPV